MRVRWQCGLQVRHLNIIIRAWKFGADKAQVLTWIAEIAQPLPLLNITLKQLFAYLSQDCCSVLSKGWRYDAYEGDCQRNYFKKVNTYS